MQARPYRTLEAQIDGVVVTFNDITKLKVAEQGLAMELRAMARLQELSTKVMEANKVSQPLGAILDAIIELTGANFGCIQIYDEGSKTLRLVADRVLQKQFLHHIEAVDTSSDSITTTALVRRERIVAEDIEKVAELATSLDEARAAGYKAVIAAPLCATSGKLVGILSVHFRDTHTFSPHELRIVDICARQAADAMSVNSLQQQLREADRRKDEFLAMLGHELRNPLTPIHNAIQVRKRSNLNSDEIKRLYDLMQRQMTQLLRLVDDLLDIARITRGKIELRLRPVDLKEAIQQAVEMTRVRTH